MTPRLLLYSTIISLAFFASSCSKKYVPVRYNSKNVVKPPRIMSKGDDPHTITVLVTEIQDGLLNDPNKLHSWGKAKMDVGTKKVCINASSNYHKDFVKYLSRFGTQYLHQSTGFRVVSNANVPHDYVLKWRLSEYYVEQDYSKEALRDAIKIGVAVVGFGLVGVMVYEAGDPPTYFKSPGEITITFDLVEISHPDRGNIASLDSTTYFLQDELYATTNCMCAYENIDLHFKYFIKELGARIEEEILKDLDRQ